jgi:hypothetical protein
VPNGIASLARVESLSSNQSRAGLCCANDSTLRIDEIEQDHLEASPSATAVGCERSTIQSRKACFPTLFPRRITRMPNTPSLDDVLLSASAPVVGAG